MTALFLALTMFAIASQETSDVSAIFNALRNPSPEASAPLQQPKQPIKIYAIDDTNTKICYISNDVIHIYSNGRVVIPLYAKVFNVKAVNRITYQKSSVGGAFLIWIDDEMTLSIGA